MYFNNKIFFFRREYEGVTLHSVGYAARVLALLFGLPLNVALSEPAAAVDWPDGYVVYKTLHPLTVGSVCLFRRWTLEKE